MKKLGKVLLSIALVLSLIGCGNKNENDGGLEIDENLLTVEITIPISMMGDDVVMTQAEVDATVQEQGFISGTYDEVNQTVTYVMTKAKHRQALQDLKDSVQTAFNEMANEDPRFKSIEMNDDLSLINLYMDASQYTSFDILSGIGFMIYASLYQVFSGVELEEIDIVVQFVDDSNHEHIIETLDYKEMQNS